MNKEQLQVSINSNPCCAAHFRVLQPSGICSETSTDVCAFDELIPENRRLCCSVAEAAITAVTGESVRIRSRPTATVPIDGAFSATSDQSDLYEGEALSDNCQSRLFCVHMHMCMHAVSLNLKQTASTHHHLNHSTSETSELSSKRSGPKACCAPGCLQSKSTA